MLRVRHLLLVPLFLTPFYLRSQSANTDAATEQRVTQLLQKLTPAQKLEMLGGSNGFYIHAEPSIGLPAIRMSDGPVGLRTPEPSTAYPAGIALAATFDAELAFEEGKALGRDARSRGVHILLGPGVNLYRAPMNGRNFEYFGEDPFLASRMTVGYIQGVQSQGVSATVKHFALNNSEYDRHHVDAVVDERTLHELYLPTFEAAVTEANVGAIMNSYNLVNGVHATQNPMLNNQIAKGDWKFQGVIMSDWNSVYDGPAAANAGLDLEMPSAKFMTPANLQGKVTQDVIDDKIRRILRLAVRMGWLDHPQSLDAPKDDPASRAVARRVALESMVLLKNDGALLPLSAAKICTLAVIGPNANAAAVGGGGSGKVVPPSALSFAQALQSAFPAHDKCPGAVFAAGIPKANEIFRTTHFIHGLKLEQFASNDPKGPASITTAEHLVAVEPQTRATSVHAVRYTADYMPVADGKLLLVLQSGYQDHLTLTADGKEIARITEPEGHPVLTAVVDSKAGVPLRLVLSGHITRNPDGLGLGVIAMNTLVSKEAVALASKADAAVVVAGFDAFTEGEGFDRSFALPGGQEELISAVAAANKHTIVALTAGGGVEMARWLDSIPAVMHLWYPGEEGAPAFADVLSGKVSPEGHLPISIERSFADNPAHGSYFPGEGSKPGHPVTTLREGVMLGYRGYATTGTKPLFSFGAGMSYTTFSFAHLHADNTPQGVVVSVDVKNTGSVPGGDAVQVYVSDLSATIKRPAIELKAFRKVHLEPKEAQHLQFTLDRRAFAYWSETKHGWQVDSGTFAISVGDSSDNLPLKANITLDAIAPAPKPAAPAANVSTTPAGTSRALSAYAPAYNGTKEYSLEIQATKFDQGKKEWQAPKSYKTRIMEQLAGFTPSTIALDKWGGRMDISAEPTGFFYTKKIGDRWWAIDPEGHAYFHQAVVNLSPNTGPNGRAAMDKLYGGDKSRWMSKTHSYLLSLGIQGAGAWSNTDLIRSSPLQSAHPIAYTVNLDVMSKYGKQRGGMHADVGHVGYLNDTIFAFDPGFPKFADSYIKSEVQQYKNDPALFGYFSDNEMPVRRENLEHYLDLPHSEPGYQFAKKFMDDRHAKSVTDELSEEFLAIEIDHYASAISAALKKYDPHHMYIGCRYTGRTEQAPEAFAALGKYADAISVNYYNSWTPDFTMMKEWEAAAKKPIMITEWYTKGRDSGMPNKTGAGWLVATQAQRGAFYQNYAMALIESKIVIGWHWFKYQDNDPNDPNAEASNKDSNKGIVNIGFQAYAPLTDRIRQLNPNAYALADYFDRRAKP